MARVADACTATAIGLACTIMVADCLPVLFTDGSGQRVAAAHAGWRGLAGGVLEQAARCFAPEPEAGPARGDSKVIAWLGPLHRPEGFRGRCRGQGCVRGARAGSGGLLQARGVARQMAGGPAALWRASGCARAGVDAVYGNDGGDSVVHRRQPVTVLFAPARRHQRALRRAGLEGLTSLFRAQRWLGLSRPRVAAARRAASCACGLALLDRAAPARRAHQVNHQCHRRQSVQKKCEDGAQHGARGVGGFGHRHHHDDVEPADHDQMDEHKKFQSVRGKSGVVGAVRMQDTQNTHPSGFDSGEDQET
jgi:hypothetical protein